MATWSNTVAEATVARPAGSGALLSLCRHRTDQVGRAGRRVGPRARASVTPLWAADPTGPATPVARRRALKTKPGPAVPHPRIAGGPRVAHTHGPPPRPTNKKARSRGPFVLP